MNRIKAPTFFIIFGFLFGVVFLILTPPFQVPDEVNHFYRAYHIAEGHFSATKQDNRLGGYMPTELVKAVNTNLYLKGNPYTRISKKDILKQLNMPSEDNNTVFVDFPNTALYTPISYLPQSLGIALGLFLGIKSILLLYFARFAVLALWLFAAYHTIKRLPVYQWFFTLSALLPMTVFVNMSASADAITNILAFVWIGNILRLTFSDIPLLRRDILFLSLNALLLSVAKYVYTPLVFLILFIPFSKKTNHFPTFLTLKKAFLGIVFLAFSVAFLGSRYASKTYIAHKDYNQTFVADVDVPSGADINGQIAYLKAHPIQIFEVVNSAIQKTFPMLVHTYIGVLGWLDTRLPMPFVYLAYGLLACVLLYETKQNKAKINLKQRLLLLFVSFSLIFLIYLSQYLTWAGVGSPYCGSIQGRYFIPVLPLLFMALFGSGIKWHFLIVVARFGAVVILIAMLQTLFFRYYAAETTDSDMVCDAENVYEDDYMSGIYFTTNTPDRMLSNGATRSDVKARSGRYASALGNGRHYGMTYRLYNLSVGDTIKAAVWHYGEEGVLWVVSPNNALFEAQDTISAPDENGWKKLSKILIINEKTADSEIGIFVEAHSPAFFDDMQVQVRKKR